MTYYRQKSISLLLLALLVLSPVTSMAMQLSMQLDQSGSPCHEPELVQKDMVQQENSQQKIDHMVSDMTNCQMGDNCQDLCGPNSHCTSSVTILINTLNNLSFSSENTAFHFFETQHTSQFHNSLFRPPRV